MSTPIGHAGARLPPTGSARIAGDQISINGRIAAVLTTWVGSMWAVYATLAIVATWMLMGTWGPLHSRDASPFPFLLFLVNLVQLQLCFVILVGQRVLNSAADKRAVDTYENAEAIFLEVTRLHDHLVRQDRQLSRGASLMEWDEHPWIGQHRLQAPPRASDYAVGINGRMGAWITERVGSVWAFYTAGLLQLGWIGLAQSNVPWFDHYPYSFLLLLNNLAQLILLFVIMVGQRVLGLAGDRRSEQTFHNAEAILYACRQLEAHLTAQDRIIGSLSGYVQTNVTEQLAHSLHRSYVAACLERGEAPASRPALRPWRELPEEFRVSNRDQARQAADKLAAIGCMVVPRSDPSKEIVRLDPDEIALLARMEHDRWVAERSAQGFVRGPVRARNEHPDLVPWEELSSEEREKDAQFVRDLPRLLAEVGFEIMRLPVSAA